MGSYWDHHQFVEDEASRSGHDAGDANGVEGLGDGQASVGDQLTGDHASYSSA